MDVEIFLFDLTRDGAGRASLHPPAERRQLGTDTGATELAFAAGPPEYASPNLSGQVLHQTRGGVGSNGVGFSDPPSTPCGTDPERGG
jgi:hypothetical protein